MAQNNSDILDAALLLEKNEQEKILIQLIKNKEKIENNEKEYFDEEAEKVSLDSYYKTIDFNRLNSQELYKELQYLLESTHTPVNYNPTRYLYNWVDLQ